MARKQHKSRNPIRRDRDTTIPNTLRVKAHAVIRYLERVEGFDLQDLRYKLDNTGRPFKPGRTTDDRKLESLVISSGLVDGARIHHIRQSIKDMVYGYPLNITYAVPVRIGGMAFKIKLARGYVVTLYPAKR